MSGHSKWSTIKHKKGAADAKRGKIFTRLIREITTAAKMGGGDPAGNPRLRAAIDDARAENMPNDNITKAIKRGTGELEGVSYEEVTYEGYGPHGVAIMVKCLTDNRNRTVSEIRYAFSRHNGSLAETGSVAWMFKRKGVIVVPTSAVDENKLMEMVLDYDVDDISTEVDFHEITLSPDALDAVKQRLQQEGIKIQEASLTYVAENGVKLSGDQASSVVKLLTALEDQDDTQEVVSNFDVDEKELSKLMQEQP